MGYDITLYTSHCPACIMMEKIMGTKNINFTIEDKEEVFLPLAEENNISQMPFAKINGELYPFNQLKKFIQEFKQEV